MSAVEKGLYLNWNTLCMSYWCSFFSCQQFDSNAVLRLFFLKSIHLYVRFCSSDALCHRWNNHGNYNLLANFVGLIFIIWKNTFPENCWLHASKMNHPEITKKKRCLSDSYTSYLRKPLTVWTFKSLAVYLAPLLLWVTCIVIWPDPLFPVVNKSSTTVWGLIRDTRTHTYTKQVH